MPEDTADPVLLRLGNKNISFWGAKKQTPSVIAPD